MTQIGKYPLVDRAYNLCLAIEECGASEKLTNAVTIASKLMEDLEYFCEKQADLESRNREREFGKAVAKILVDHFAQISKQITCLIDRYGEKG